MNFSFYPADSQHSRRVHPSGRAAVAGSHYWLAPLLLILLPALTACQTATQTAMSVEEAKRVTTTFAGQPFAAPPRTVTDVMAVFGPLCPGAVGIEALRVCEMERIRRSAATSVGVTAGYSWLDTADPVVAGKTYHSKGREARRIGRFAEAIFYYKAAAERIQPLSGVQEDTGWPWRTDLGVAILRDLADTEAAMGNYWNAIKTYERAIATVSGRLRGWPELWSGLAELYAKTGDLKAAERTLAELQGLTGPYRDRNRVFSSYASDPRQIAEATSALAATRAALAQAAGRLGEAERFWRQSIQILEQKGVAGSNWLDERHRARVSRLAECLLRQGRVVEAEVETRRTIWLRDRDTRFSYDHLGPVTLLARIMRAQGRFVEGEVLARMAIRLYAEGGASPVSSPSVIAPRLELAADLAAQGQWSQALDEYTSAKRDFADDPLWDRTMGTDPAFLYSLLRVRRLPEATVALNRALAEAQRTRGEDHAATAELRGLRAMLYVAVGDRTRALEDFRIAAQVLLTRRGERDDEVTTDGEQDERIRVIWGSYVSLLADLGGTSPSLAPNWTAEAFRVAEAVHIRSVQRALDASAARSAARSPELADLVRREQDASKQIAALQGLLVTALSGFGNPGVEGDLRRRVDDLQRARQTLTQQVARDFPTYEELVNPAPLTVEQAQAALRPGEALIATLVTVDQTFVWALPQRGPLTFVRAPIGEKALDAAVSHLRKALDPRATMLGGIPEFDVEAAYELYRTLLEPVRNGWAEAESLLIVSHGPLAKLTFTLLPTGPSSRVQDSILFSNYRRVPWLIRRHGVTTLPSVNALVTLRRTPRTSGDRRPFVGFGDPYFNAEQARRAALEEVATAPAGELPTRTYRLAMRDVLVSPAAEVETSKLGMLPRLPDTAEEIRSIARAMNADLSRDVFLGVAANEQTVKTLDLARYRVIAFATHGLVPGDIDGLTQPALALTAPDIAKIEGDGLLTMDEVLALRLDADWVVLSACNTANGAGAGAEALSGLGRAFFYAGARALLVTHWPVETTSARVLTTDLFRRQAADPTLTRAQALRQTLNAMIESGEYVDPQSKQTIFSYAHPIFWAPFTLVGDGGGGGGAAR